MIAFRDAKFCCCFKASDSDVMMKDYVYFHVSLHHQMDNIYIRHILVNIVL